MRWRRAAETPGRSLRAYETAIRDTPARRAMSAIVAARTVQPKPGPYAPAMMRKVIVHPDGVRVHEAEIPAPGPGEAQLRMVLAGVCGSDTHALRGRHPNVHPPYAPGHEVVGVVTAVAGDVTAVLVGQRVTVEPDLPCWTCKQCRHGRQNLCERLGFFGCGSAQGGMADTFTIDARRLHAVPDDLDD